MDMQRIVTFIQDQRLNMYRCIENTELRVDIANRGYIYFNDSSHPLNSGGKVYYHRHIMSIHLGRWLTSTEIVHHIDYNPQNNNITNLVVMSVEEHGKLHAKALSKNTIYCKICGKEILGRGKYFCSQSCTKISLEKVYIPKEELELLIWNLPFSTVGSILGMSDNGVRKKAISYNCRMPPPRFHSKTEKYREEQRALYNIPKYSPFG